MCNNLLKFTTKFGTEERCLLEFAKVRWGSKVACAHCFATTKVYDLKKQGYYRCSNCKKDFTAKVGSVFEGSKISMKKWFLAIYLYVSHKKAISATQLSKDLEVTKKTSCFILQKLQYIAEKIKFDDFLDNTSRDS